MVMPAMQLAAKVPDVYLQLWSASLLKGSIFLLFGEANKMLGNPFSIVAFFIILLFNISMLLCNFILYCIVMYCFELYCVVLYCIVLYCIVFYSIV